MLLLAAATLLAAVAPDDPRVQLTLGGRARYAIGATARVEVRPATDGHLLVLQAEPDGMVRVLFPVDPADDAFVQGDAAYQLRDRGGRPGVLPVTIPGRGVVLAALARGPLAVEPFTVNGRWDRRQFRVGADEALEDGLLRLAEAIGGGRVAWDAAGYVDDGELVAEGRARSVPLASAWGPWGSPWWGLGYGYGAGAWGGGWANGWYGPGWFGGGVIVVPDRGGPARSAYAGRREARRPAASRVAPTPSTGGELRGSGGGGWGGRSGGSAGSGGRDLKGASRGRGSR